MLDERLRNLDRAGELSLTQQLVDAFVAAIDEGEFAAGAKLPPTRALAELAGVNQLTAGRVYRRLAQMGLVVSGVGRGTFVREAAPLRGDDAAAIGDTWQNYVLPPAGDSAATRMVRELESHAENADLIPLSPGYPPPEMFPLAQLRAATSAVLEGAGRASFQYGPVEGAAELRAELAALARLRGVDEDPDCILVTTGARQALFLTARAILRPGDKAACESPSFMGIIGSLRATGAELLPVPVDEGGLSVDALEQLLARHEIRVLALQSRLQNPTGHDLSPERRERLVALARQHGFFIVEDSVYADLRLEGSGPPSLRTLDPDHVIGVDSLSKTLSPGLRIGWVAANGPVFDRIATEKRNDDGHSPTLTQQIVARYLADGHYESQLETARSAHRVRRDAMVAAVARHMDDLVVATRPTGGANVWATLRRSVDEQQLYREAIAAGVSFTPGSATLVETPRATHMRLSFSFVEPAVIDEGVRRLSRVVRMLQARGQTRRSVPLA
jgi:GntR family transcriptional regulator/MocR family aminotransferase